MTYQPLHHKYRPQTFAELVGQEAIATTLTNALRQQRIAPAYLFTGARGTGKTSSARILAKSLNCLNSQQPTETPCGVCDVCRAIARGDALDVIEIDAASNTGVDNIRELIERAQFAPVQCRYKVYIIDEVHMLSTAAFNALLKTLEEPPNNVIFVLATTDPQRVLPTIISRCQRFDFRRIPLADLVRHLHAIAQKEQIAITPEAITLVAQLSQGGLRDAESLLDQLSLLDGEVTAEQVWDLVGSVPEQDLMALLEAIAVDNPETLLDSTRRLMERGREPLIVLQNLAAFYRDLVIAKTAPNRSDLVALTAPTWAKLCQFAKSLDIGAILAGQQHLRASEGQLKHTTQPRLWLEVTLMGLLPSALIRPSVSQPSGSAAKMVAGPAVATHPPVTAPSTGPSVSQSTAGWRSENPTIPTPPPTPAQPAPPSQAAAVSPTVSPPHQIEQPSNQPATRQPDLPPEPAIEPTVAPLQTSELPQIWQQVIAHLHPLSKALLNDYGRLLAFDGHQARIGITSEKLVKIAQNQLKNVEKAFETLYGQVVKVSLEVTKEGPGGPSSQPGAGTHATSGMGPQPSPGNGAAGSPLTNNHSPSPSDSPMGAIGVVDKPKPSQKSQKAAPVQPESVPSAIAASVETADDSSGNSGWPQDDELTTAAKRLADFFGGKVVDLTDDLSALAPTATGGTTGSQYSQEVASSEPLVETEDEDNDDDVPF